MPSAGVKIEASSGRSGFPPGSWSMVGPISLMSLTCDIKTRAIYQWIEVLGFLRLLQRLGSRLLVPEVERTAERFEVTRLDG